uniref:Uncharacterized protein n=1 Tax=Astyanax mexicanus TaxID=7994 RepID=A0A8B9HIK9_ASTMX
AASLKRLLLLLLFKCSRGKGNRQAGEVDGEKREKKGVWVIAGSTKGEASWAGENLLREGGEGQSGGTSEAAREADSE